MGLDLLEERIEKFSTGEVRFVTHPLSFFLFVRVAI